MFCPNCGNKVEEGEEFCGFCGARIAGTSENEEYTRNGAKEYDDVVTVRKTGHKRKRIKTILPVVLVIGIVAFAWVKKDSTLPLLEKKTQGIGRNRSTEKRTGLIIPGILILLRRFLQVIWIR